MQIAVSITPTVVVRSDSFNPNQTAGSVLCLEVGRDRFRFMVQDSNRQNCYLEDYTFPSLLTDRPLTDVLPDVFRDHPVLSAGPWREVRIGVNSPSFTLVPEPLFRKEYVGTYLALMRGSALPAHEFGQAFCHEAEGFLSVFTLEHELADYFSGAYPLQPLTFIHQIGALIQATADLNRPGPTSQNVWLFFEDEFVSIIYRDGPQLRYCNRFGYKNVQDMAYYVLYVLDEQKLSPDVRVVLSGEITPFSDAYSELSRFLTHVTFGQMPPGLAFAREFEELPEHRYLSLYGLGLLANT